jgi:2-polyprenyl-6-methoxyphenol hydroxylase-like FAD-dependent oxidoreductase
MSAPKVLISGSGIAGSVFAFALLRAYPKANITIVERAPSLRLTGASVDIRSNAVDIIKWAGVEQQIRDASTKEAGMSFVNSDGRVGFMRQIYLLHQVNANTFRSMSYSWSHSAYTAQGKAYLELCFARDPIFVG